MGDAIEIPSPRASVSVGTDERKSRDEEGRHNAHAIQSIQSSSMYFFVMARALPRPTPSRTLIRPHCLNQILIKPHQILALDRAAIQPHLLLLHPSLTPHITMPPCASPTSPSHSSVSSSRPP
jgi:hypothetical protein